jgi:hypothetical protein
MKLRNVYLPVLSLGGQAGSQSPHRMHLELVTESFFEGSSPTGQERAQAPQLMHFCDGFFTFIMLILPNGPKIAPRGHR